MYVCLCRGVTDRAIRAEIARGACTVEQIAECTGAGTGCGRCRCEIAGMILEAEITPPSLHLARRVSLPVVAEAEAEAESASETRAA